MAKKRQSIALNRRKMILIHDNVDINVPLIGVRNGFGQHEN